MNNFDASFALEMYKGTLPAAGTRRHDLVTIGPDRELLLLTAPEQTEADELQAALERACAERSHRGWYDFRDLLENGLDVLLNDVICMKVFTCFDESFSLSRQVDAELIRIAAVCAKRFSGNIPCHVSSRLIAMIEPLFQQNNPVIVMSSLLEFGYYLAPTACSECQLEYLSFLINLAPKIGLYGSFPDSAYMLCYCQLMRCCEITDELADRGLCPIMCHLLARRDWSFQRHALDILVLLLEKHEVVRKNHLLIETMVSFPKSVSRESAIVWEKIVRALTFLITDETMCLAFIDSGTITAIMETVPNHDFVKLESLVFDFLVHCVNTSSATASFVSMDWLSRFDADRFNFQSKMNFARLIAIIILEGDTAIISELTTRFGSVLTSMLDSDDDNIILQCLEVGAFLAQRQILLFQDNILALQDLCTSENPDVAQQATALLKYFE